MRTVVLQALQARSRALTPLRGGVLGAILVAMLVAGCSPAAPPRASGAPGSPLPVPTLASWNGACAGVGLLKAALTGDPADPRVAWLQTPNGRQDVVFPPGFSARFTPLLQILDATGKVVARDGDVIDGGCVTGADAGGPLLILGG
jgi:hypothetical protein